DEILKLAQVTWPRMALACSQCLSRYSPLRNTVVTSQALHKVFQQDRDFFPPLVQWREGEGKNTPPGKEAAAQVIIGTARIRLNLTCSHDADIQLRPIVLLLHQSGML